MRTINTNGKLYQVIENMREAFKKFIGDIDEKETTKRIKSLTRKIWNQKSIKPDDAPKLRWK